MNLIENIQRNTSKFLVWINLDDNFTLVIWKHSDWEIVDIRAEIISNKHKLNQLLWYPDIILKLEEELLKEL